MSTLLSYCHSLTNKVFSSPRSPATMTPSDDATDNEMESPPVQGKGGSSRGRQKKGDQDNARGPRRQLPRKEKKKQDRYYDNDLHDSPTPVTTAKKAKLNHPPRGTSAAKNRKNPKNKKAQAVVTPRASITAQEKPNATRKRYSDPLMGNIENDSETPHASITAKEKPNATRKRYSDPLMGNNENDSEMSENEEEIGNEGDEAYAKKNKQRGDHIAAMSNKSSCSEEDNCGGNEDDQSRTSSVSAAAFNDTSPMSNTASLGYRLKVSEELNREYEDRVRELESQLRSMKGMKKKYTKKELAQHYEWDETDVTLGNIMMNACKKYLFPRYKFLGDNWTEYDPRPDRLTSVVFTIIRSAIPAEEDPENLWNRVLAPAISKKYADLRCNINNQCKMTFLGK